MVRRWLGAVAATFGEAFTGKIARVAIADLTAWTIESSIMKLNAEVSARMSESTSVFRFEQPRHDELGRNYWRLCSEGFLASGSSHHRQ